MIGSILRHFVKFFGWLIITCFAVALNIWAILEHYLSAKNALELLGFEQSEIWRDKLVGPIIGVFVPSATLPMALALTIAAGQTICLFIVFNDTFSLFDLLKHRREHLESANENQDVDSDNNEDEERKDQAAAYRAELVSASKAEVRAANTRIIETAVYLAVFAIFLVIAINYEMELFRFRSFAGIQQYDSPSDAVTIPTWENLVTTKGGYFAYQLAHWGAWGYLAFTALCCLALERSLRKVGERYQQFCNSLSADQEQEQPIGYDYDGNPVFDANTQIYYDSNGYPVEDFEPLQAEAVSAGTVPPHPVPDATYEPSIYEPASTIPPISHQQSSQETLFDPPAAPPEPQTDEPFVVQQADGSELREVISATGTRVSLAEALANPDVYFVNHATGQIWDRAYWNTLHEPDSDSQSGDDPESSHTKSASV